MINSFSQESPSLTTINHKHTCSSLLDFNADRYFNILQGPFYIVIKWIYVTYILIKCINVNQMPLVFSIPFKIFHLLSKMNVNFRGRLNFSNNSYHQDNLYHRNQIGQLWLDLPQRSITNHLHV